MTRLGRRARSALLGSLLASGLTVPAAAVPRPLHHVRVVLDISRSMLKNDHDRLAPLATVLLADLVAPNPSLGDTFEVLPFDPKWSWKDGPPPSTNGTPIRFELGRESFAKALHDLPYDGRSTYFYPGLRAAIDDLQNVKGAAADIKAVVLVTDGVPLADKRDIEARLIAAELQPRMLEKGIRFYVLAFGPEASANQAYLDSLVQSAKGPLGTAIVDPDGKELLGSMLKIFSRSFGYSPDSPQALPATRSLDLKLLGTPEKVAVVVLAKRPAPFPRLDLTPPPGGQVNREGGVRSAAEPGASYSLQWVLQPSSGVYRFESDANPGSVAVLRPIRLELAILPSPPHTQTARAMAKTAFPLWVLVRNPAGAAGAPAPLDLAFRPLGERRGASFSWLGDWSAPVSGEGSVTPEGRIYEISPEFPENREVKGQVYTGHLEVRAKSGEAVVASLRDEHAHAVEVHPFLAIAPAPLAGYAAEKTLSRRQEGCTSFKLSVEAGTLPHLDRGEYPIQAVLEAGPTVLDRELHEATFSLDGLALEPAARPAPQTGEWRRGRMLTTGEFLGSHRLCVHLGRPKAGDPAKPLELQVAFTLREDPYDDFHVVKSFLLKVLVEPPGFVERWRAYLWGSFALLALLAALWYLRDRPVLPPDLRCTVGRESGAAAADALGEPTFGSRFLGLADERPVVAPGEDRLLGRVQAADEELFRFRPARGMTVEPLTDGERLTTLAGAVVLAVHRTYRLHTPDGAYTLRLEYR